MNVEPAAVTRGAQLRADGLRLRKRALRARLHAAILVLAAEDAVLTSEINSYLWEQARLRVTPVPEQ